MAPRTERARRWLAVIPTLIEYKLRVSFAQAELYVGSTEDLAESMNALCQLAEQAHPTARETLVAFVPTIVDIDHVERITLVREAAVQAQMPAVGRLLRCSTPVGHSRPAAVYGQADEPLQPEQIIADHSGRTLTLGERRALARKPSRGMLEKLCRDPHPMVIQIVLANPYITEEDVIAMAARRPALPAVIREIAKAWAPHARVRMAVVLNPGSPPAVTVPLLPLLARPELTEVCRATWVPAVVRATAREVAAFRPPLADPPGGADARH